MRGMEHTKHAVNNKLKLINQFESKINIKNFLFTYDKQILCKLALFRSRCNKMSVQFMCDCLFNVSLRSCVQIANNMNISDPNVKTENSHADIVSFIWNAKHLWKCSVLMWKYSTPKGNCRILKWNDNILGSVCLHHSHWILYNMFQFLKTLCQHYWLLCSIIYYERIQVLFTFNINQLQQ